MKGRVAFAWTEFVTFEFLVWRTSSFGFHGNLSNCKSRRDRKKVSKFSVNWNVDFSAAGPTNDKSGANVDAEGSKYSSSIL